MKLVVDNEKFKAKPGVKLVGTLQNRLNQAQDVSFDELVQIYAEGQTTRACVSSSREDTWKEQQLFYIDIDNGIKIEDAISKYEYLKPCIIYTSFSHTETHHKFRIIFKTREPITDYSQAKSVQLSLMSVIKEHDISCKNLSRLWFGGKEVVYQNENNTIDTDALIKMHTVEPSFIMAKPTIKTKTPKTINTGNHVERIKALDVEGMKSLLNKGLRDILEKRRSIKEDIYNSFLYYAKNPPSDVKPFIFSTSSDLYSFMNQIDLYDFLGIKDEFFNCIMPNHNDLNPSAHIYIADDGAKLYKCFGCGGNGLTIVTLVSELARCSRMKAINFIKDVYNLKLEKSEWQKQAIEELEMIKEYIYSTDFEREYPNLYKRLKRKLNKFNAFIDVAIRNVREENSADEKPIFWCTYRELETVFDTKSPETIAKTINLFALLSFIHKNEASKIPEQLLQKGLGISKSKGYKKISTYYSIGGFGHRELMKSENRAIELKEKNFSMKGLSREWVLRTFGVDVANEIYPQYKDENTIGVSRKSNYKTNEIVKVTFMLIEKQSYATEKQIVEILRDKFGKTGTEKQIKRSIFEILNGYGLKRIRASKETKEQYQINSAGYPFIIVKETI